MPAFARAPVGLRAESVSFVKLARHTLFNLVGLGAPLLVALLSIPALLHGLGEARFGLLTLIWSVTGYFGVFDLGLGRALTQAMAGRLAAKQEHETPPLMGTALTLLLGLGLLAAVLLILLAPWGIAWLRGLQDADEALQATRCLALGLPAILLTAGLRGGLEAAQAFGWVNLIRLPMGLWTFLGPWAVLWLRGPDLLAITAVLVLGRYLGLLAHMAAVARCAALPRPRLAWVPHWAGVLLRSGGWMTVSNVISPLMGYVDRFMVGASVSAAAVSWYATGQELVSKLWILPGAITAVLFPAFAAAGPGSAATLPLFNRSLRALVAVVLPPTAFIALFAQELLAWWLSPEFAQAAAPMLRLFAVGTLINCLAHIPFTLLQGSGDARTTALLHVIELPLFLLGLSVGVAQAGALGAAWVWLGRIVLDTALMFIACMRKQGWRWGDLCSVAQVWQALGVGVALAAMAADSTAIRLLALLLGASIAAAALLPSRAHAGATH